MAFVDPSGGLQDAMALGVAHKERAGVVLDLIAERRPSVSPETGVAEFATILKQYRVTGVTGDRFGGEWFCERFRVHEIGFRIAEQSKSEIYGAFLPLLTSGRVQLLDHSTFIRQLLALDRRVARGGRESIDHPRGGRDDLANAAAGALVLANRSPISLGVTSPPDDRPCPLCKDHHPSARCPFGAPTAAEIIRLG